MLINDAHSLPLQDITSSNSKHDPRLKRLAEKQFDLVSKTLEQGGASFLGLSAAQAAERSAAAVGAEHSAPVPQLDPRGRDPRLRPGGEPEQDFQQMVNQQIRMANQLAEQQHNAGDVDLRAPGFGSPRAFEEPAAQTPFYEGYGRRPGPPGRPGRHPNARPHRDAREPPKPRRDYEERFGREERFDDRRPLKRGRSPSPKAPEPPLTEVAPAAPQTLREKRKNNEYESPLAKTSRF